MRGFEMTEKIMLVISIVLINTGILFGAGEAEARYDGSLNPVVTRAEIKNTSFSLDWKADPRAEEYLLDLKIATEVQRFFDINSGEKTAYGYTGAAFEFEKNEIIIPASNFTGAKTASFSYPLPASVSGSKLYFTYKLTARYSETFMPEDGTAEKTRKVYGYTDVPFPELPPAAAAKIIEDFTAENNRQTALKNFDNFIKQFSLVRTNWNSSTEKLILDAVQYGIDIDKKYHVLPLYTFDNTDEKLAQQRTLLMIAAGSGSLEVLKVLTEKGADLNIEDEFGLNALDYAANDNIRQYLLSKGAKRSKTFFANQMADIIKSQNPDLGKAKKLLEQGLDLNSMAVTESGERIQIVPLFTLAVFQNSAVFLPFFIDNGFRFDNKRIESLSYPVRRPEMHFAADQNLSEAVFKKLLAMGLDFSKPSYGKFDTGTGYYDALNANNKVIVDYIFNNNIQLSTPEENSLYYYHLLYTFNAPEARVLQLAKTAAFIKETQLYRRDYLYAAVENAYPELTAYILQNRDTKFKVRVGTKQENDWDRIHKPLYNKADRTFGRYAQITISPLTVSLLNKDFKTTQLLLDAGAYSSFIGRLSDFDANLNAYDAISDRDRKMFSYLKNFLLMIILKTRKGALMFSIRL
jgi:hypothetical protein